MNKIQVMQMLLVYLGSVKYLIFIYFLGAIVFVRSDILLILNIVWPSILFSAGQILSVRNLLIATTGFCLLFTVTRFLM